ncbi:hypothetical protein EIN_345810 [Entamoeba invadens IP1]|uniref:PARP catalytic domain-containing protein n=1 Tax=Entamoeba invadens IP1 TaxID=370355 RepID=L7FK49_ENTIV|nr:hypothetical protein EIN_345810 [Entamoeba invadens IP1]ELP83995.1 hypothetical protein EIN_345810 [Entamoeba invadens IP1]|eukprot:XP_004183341.1 hypothetical protein EIN_345810 [Entamoeba invadens IP1]
MVEYIPFHKNCKNMTVVGELEITPDGIGCKVNEFLQVMYFACKSADEMKSIQDHGFPLVDGNCGKGVYMYRNYSDAIADSSNFIIFTRVTKGNFKEIVPSDLPNLNITNIDRVVLTDGDKITNCIYNTANIDIIAFLEFVDK